MTQMRHNEDDEDFSYEDDEPGSGVEGRCSCCGEVCTSVVRDLGIGSYEFWGHKSVHHDYQVVSPCCDAEMKPLEDEEDDGDETEEREGNDGTGDDLVHDSSHEAVAGQ